MLSNSNKTFIYSKFKTLLSLLICAMISMLPLASFAEEITLPDKLKLQIEAGSGFRGNLALSCGSADDEDWTELLNTNLRYIQAENEDRLVLQEDEENPDTDKLVLSISDNSCYIGVNDELYFLKDYMNGIISEITGILSAYLGAEYTMRLLVGAVFSSPEVSEDTQLLRRQKVDEINAVIERVINEYSIKMDLWLKKFSLNATKQTLDDGTGAMSMSYDVPVDDVKEFVKVLLDDAVEDEQLLDALSQYMDEESKELFLNTDNLQYAKLAVDWLPLKGSVQIKKTYTYKGELLETYVNLPMIDISGDAYNIIYKQNADLDKKQNIHSITSKRESSESTLTFTITEQSDNKLKISGSLHAMPYKATRITKPIAVSFEFEKNNEIFIDDLGDNNQSIKYSGFLEQDNTYLEQLVENEQENYLSLSKWDFSLDLLYTSGVAKNTSTSVNIDAVAKNETSNTKWKLATEAKTTSFWDPEELNKETADEVNFADNSVRHAFMLQIFTKYRNTFALKLAGQATQKAIVEQLNKLFNINEPVADQIIVEPTTEITIKPSLAPTLESTPKPTIASDTSLVPTVNNNEEEKDTIVTIIPTPTATPQLENTVKSTQTPSLEPTATKSAE